MSCQIGSSCDLYITAVLTQFRLWSPSALASLNAQRWRMPFTTWIAPAKGRPRCHRPSPRPCLRHGSGPSPRPCLRFAGCLLCHGSASVDWYCNTLMSFGEVAFWVIARHDFRIPLLLHLRIASSWPKGYDRRWSRSEWNCNPSLDLRGEFHLMHFLMGLRVLRHHRLIAPASNDVACNF